MKIFQALLVSSWMVGAAVSVCAQGGHSAVTPVPRGNDWWKERADLLNQRVKETPQTRLLFIGDSITQGWEGAGKEVWETRYAPYDAVNLGIGGDRTQHVLYRLQNGNLKGIAPEVAVVMIGTNNSNGIDNTAAQIADGVGAIVETLRSQVPDAKILLLGIFPRGENINDQRGKILQVNQILAKHHDGEHVHYLDIGHAFITLEGRIPGEIMPDYLHLSPQGYTVWADAIAPHLEKWLGQAASPLSGKWTFVIVGPNGEDVEMDLVIEQEGARFKGSLGVGERQFPLEEVTAEGQAIAFKVARDRPNGGEMVYHLCGEIENGVLKGKVTTEIEGESIERDWKAHPDQE